MLTHIPSGLSGIMDTFGSLDTPHFEARYIESFTLPYPLLYGEVKVTRARGHYLAIPHFLLAPEGVRGWGAKGELELRKIRGTAQKG